jgi:broad specificity phosphatase PhoE
MSAPEARSGSGGAAAVRAGAAAAASAPAAPAGGAAGAAAGGLAGGGPGASSPPQQQRQHVGYDHIAALVHNPEPQQDSPSVKLAQGEIGLAGSIGDRYVVALVGLPATGKTYMARRICQYLQFFHGAKTEVFNVGNYRRKKVGAKSPHSFFDPDNAESVQLRDQCAAEAMADLKEFIKKTSRSSEPLLGAERDRSKTRLCSEIDGYHSDEDRGGRVAVYDATNTTRDRRHWIAKQLEGLIESKNKIIFVESVVNVARLIDNNIRQTKLSMPDYEGIDEASAVEDFKKRIEHYRKVYEPMDIEGDADLAWVKITDGGRHISMNNISGFLPGRLVQFLMNLHTIPRPIYLSRHGQSTYNRLGKIGGDSALSDKGECYAHALAKFVHTEILGLNEDGSFKDTHKRVVPHARLFTSSLQRTRLTARHIVHHKCDDGWIIMRPRVCPALDEIYAGVFDGMTYEEIRQRAPDEFSQRKLDKLGYRYPRGESYLDVIQRLDPIVHEVERQEDPVLVVGHQGILRILYAYFVGKSRDEAPHVSIPLNHVIKLDPRAYSCEVTRINLGEGQPWGGDDEAPSH